MFRFSHGFVLRRATLAGLLAACVSLAATAAQPQQQSGGLGQAWPNAQDVSSSPRWHVYVFERDGIRYFQVNDLNGTVRAAVATANGQFLVLPIGHDASLVTTSSKPASPAATRRAMTNAPAETVYQDNAVQLQVVPQSNGNVQMNAMEQPCDPRECGIHMN